MYDNVLSAMISLLVFISLIGIIAIFLSVRYFIYRIDTIDKYETFEDYINLTIDHTISFDVILTVISFLFLPISFMLIFVNLIDYEYPILVNGSYILYYISLIILIIIIPENFRENDYGVFLLFGMLLLTVYLSYLYYLIC